jgi:hypothetical protein
MIIQIIAPHFVAAVDTTTHEAAPIVHYMASWNAQRVEDYCEARGWLVTYIGKEDETGS